MAAIISAKLDLNKIEKHKIYEGKKGKYYPITITLNDETSQYGSNGYICTEQTKDERDQKVPKSFLGDIKVVWTNGVAPTKADQDGGGDNAGTTQNPIQQNEGLPF